MKLQEVFSHHPTLELVHDVLYNAHLLVLDSDNSAMVFLSRVWMPQLLVHHWGLDASTWSITWVHSPEVLHLVQSQYHLQVHSPHQMLQCGYSLSRS